MRRNSTIRPSPTLKRPNKVTSGDRKHRGAVTPTEITAYRLGIAGHARESIAMIALTPLALNVKRRLPVEIVFLDV
jgi:hypothetical protein